MVWKSKEGLMGIGMGLIVGALLLQLATFGQTARSVPMPSDDLASMRYALVIPPNVQLETLALALIDVGVLTERQKFIQMMQKELGWQNRKQMRYVIFEQKPTVEQLVGKLNAQ